MGFMENIIDVLIIGAGPAGLTAGIYSSRTMLKTVIIEKMSAGGEIANTEIVENYPGFPEGIPGYELGMKFKEQAEKFGCTIVSGTVLEIKKGADIFTLTTDSEQYTARAIIIATGEQYAHLGIPGEDEFHGRGVSYCATCDGALFRDRTVAVVGGGDTAVQEALFLTKFVSKLYLVHRRNKLRATKILQERLFGNRKVEPVWNSVVTKISGTQFVESVTVKDVVSGAEKIILCDGVFVFVGFKPNTEFVNNLVVLDEKGFIITDSDMSTSIEGIFACGDCIRKPLRQVVTSCGEGAVAAFSAEKYLSG